MACAALFGICLISCISIPVHAANTDVSIDFTLTSDIAFERYWDNSSYSSSWDIESSGSLAPLESSSVSYFSSTVYNRFQYVALVPFDSTMSYLVVDLPNMRFGGTLYTPLTKNSSVYDVSLRAVDITYTDSGSLKWSTLASYGLTSEFYNPSIGRFSVPVSDLPAGCNGFLLSILTQDASGKSIDMFVNQSFAFCVISPLQGGSSGSGGISEDYINAALAGQTSELKQSLTSAINEAQQSNQAFLNDQYGQSVGTLPEDTAETDSMIDDLDELENEYHADAVNKFNELSATFSGFDGSVSSGISLASSLFSRVWNSMGNYVIVYTFPLLLGLALVIIGRVSRVHLPGSGDRTKGKDES